MQLAAAALALVASVGLTYFLCLRPMSRGRGCHMCAPEPSDLRGRGASENTSDDLRAAWAELAAVREAVAQQAGSVPPIDAGSSGARAGRPASVVGDT